MKPYRTFAFLALTVLIVASAVPLAAQQVIKLGSLAPADSPWDKALLRMALEWQTISGGRITVKVYSGGIAGDEPDMIRKMRINQLQAAAMTGSGLGKIRPEFLVYQLPFMTRNDEELQYLYDRLRPRLEKDVEEKGFTLLAFTRSGWLHFFAKTKVLIPEDVAKLKFFVMEGSPEVDQAWKEMGFHIVPLPANDAFAGLQSGMVEVFTASPLTAAALQWFALAPNMTDFNWTPLTGGLVISSQAWRRIPAELRPELQKSAETALQGLTGEVEKVEAQAMEIMKKNGLVIHKVSPAQIKEWERLVENALKILIDNPIPRDVYEEARGYLEEYRKTHGG
jgi:TRAP-type C4-dicarboxylate transport system substrate-binding protein